MLSILKASAGSGKTFALTYEFIRLLLGRKDADGRCRLNCKGNDRHRSILAITFTNKATDEMKRRIVSELAALAGLEPACTESPYMPMLTKCFGCKPEELRSEASRALNQLLFDFNFFHISTIDSFFQQILRTFAFEAELEGDYEVDLDTELAIARAADDIFSSLNRHPDAPESKEIMNWITGYLIDRLENGHSVALFNRASNDFDSFVKSIYHLSDETFSAHFEEMMQYFKTGSIARLAQALKQAADDSTARAVTTAGNLLDFMAHNRIPAPGSYNSYLLKALASLSETGKYPGGKTIADIAAGEGAVSRNAAGREFLKNNPGIMATIEEGCRTIMRMNVASTMCRAIGASVFVLGLFRAVYLRLEEMRANDNVLLLSDTNALLRRIIGDDDAPFIYERVGVSLRHFLIDEFQDTSKLQWDNLRPLLNESQSSGDDNLIIGDEKQCIYRFRGSAPELLKSHVENDVVPPTELRGTTPAENTNWRSSADIVEANNAIFAAVAAVYGFSDIYANVCQQTSPKHKAHRGYVDIVRFELSQGEKEESFVDGAMRRMLDEMARQLDSGYAGSDIAVLTRTRTDGQMVVAALMEAFSTDARFAHRNLRVVSDDSMTLDAAPAVRRIVAVLRALASARNIDTHEVDDASTNHYYRSRSELTNLINHYEQSLGDGKTPSEALADAVSHSAEPVLPPIDMSQLACVSLPSLVERIVAHYFPGGTVPEGQLMFVLAFEDAVTDYCALNNPDIQSFLRWWDESGHNTMVAGASDANAVRVMTIHKAKGLEFPCVHLPLLHKKIFDFKSAEWFEKIPIEGIPDELLPPLVAVRPADWMLSTPFAEEYERHCREMLLDEINVLYVAFTRAVEELTVSYCYRAPGKNSEKNERRRPTTGQLLDVALREIGRSGKESKWGMPTVAPAPEEEKSKRVIEPSELIEMPPYEVDERDELWRDTRIDISADDQLGRRRGVVFHDILANVVTSADVGAAVARAVRCGELLPSMQKRTVDELTEAMAAAPETARWFATGVRVLRERSIVMPDGETVMRPDRVVLNADGSLDVVDYKFGEEHSGKYARQVKAYVRALQEAGYPVVRGYIWYVGERRVVAV